MSQQAELDPPPTSVPGPRDHQREREDDTHRGEHVEALPILVVEGDEGHQRPDRQDQTALGEHDHATTSGVADGFLHRERQGHQRPSDHDQHRLGQVEMPPPEPDECHCHGGGQPEVAPGADHRPPCLALVGTGAEGQQQTERDQTRQAEDKQRRHEHRRGEDGQYHPAPDPGLSSRHRTWGLLSAHECRLRGDGFGHRSPPGRGSGPAVTPAIQIDRGGQDRGWPVRTAARTSRMA